MKLAAILALAAALASAQSSSYRISNGPFEPSGLGDSPQAKNGARSAGRHPNATSEVQFSLSNDDEKQSWSWRVNVTAIPVPNDRDQLWESSANYSEDLRVVNTQYELHWPGAMPGGADSSLQVYAGQHNMSMYFNVYQLYLPPNVTSNYNASANNDGSCSSILGEQCTQSFQQAVREAGQDGVQSSPLPGCENTLDVALTVTGLGFGLPNNPGSNETGRSDYFYGDTLWYQTSEAWPATNLTILNRTEESLQMLTIDVRYGSNSRGDESVVLCQIARAQSSDNSTQSGDNSTSSGGTSGAMGFGEHSKVALWSALILSLLFAL